MINIQGGELYCNEFKKNMSSIGLRSDTYELISFKFGMMIDMIKLYVWYQFEWTWLSLKVTRLWEC